MPTPYEEMECLLKLLAEVETDEDSDFDNEDNEPEDDLEENFSDHEIFSEHDTESESDGDSLNEKITDISHHIKGPPMAVSDVTGGYSSNLTSHSGPGVC
ncbi:hypothetical protein AVEN_115089-1 [Araneus ventricosus]|uniref:Uncharacterized protein n=1 Tax=Araneus ventricosus TaxID=182803 RepID=A0A4Y1ZXT0_ARAVE|nr:hypothetical protein AVEN_115089-1 [Araneus ventricosus]